MTRTNGCSIDFAPLPVDNERMTITSHADALEYIHRAHEAESEQRAEYGSGCVSLGYDPHEWAPAYEGYRAAEDPEYQVARALVAAYESVRVIPPAYRPSPDDLPF